MRRPTVFESVFVVVGGTACAALLFLSAPLWREYHARATSVTVPARPAERTQTAVRAARRAPERFAAAAATLRLDAVRGSCWIEIRSTSNRGAVRYLGTLEQGATLRAHGKRLWLSLGAAGNLDATLNGKPLREFPTGTINLIVTNEGVRDAPIQSVAAPDGNGRA